MHFKGIGASDSIISIRFGGPDSNGIVRFSGFDAPDSQKYVSVVLACVSLVLAHLIPKVLCVSVVSLILYILCVSVVLVPPII
jgi:hypothetical protein